MLSSANTPMDGAALVAPPPAAVSASPASRRSQTESPTMGDVAGITKASRASQKKRLSARPQAAWPQAPFSGSDERATIYVNAFGNAVLNGESFRGSTFNGYSIVFDDTGTMSFQTTGKTRTQVAFYGTGDKPTIVGNGGIQAPVTTKALVHVGVRPTNGKAGGSYGIVVHGVASTYVLDIPINSRTNAGHARTFISNSEDTDFFKFTTTRAGTWYVTLHPVDPKPEAEHVLNPTMVVYDAVGMPIAGSFTQALGGAGPGEDVTATLKLPASSTCYIRIGAAGEDIGQTNIQVVRQPMPAVSLSTKTRTVPTSGVVSGQFIVSRSARTGTGQALAVRYTVSGTAVNGTDYMKLSGKVIIPAHEQSAVIDLVRKAGVEGLAGKNVVLSLVASAKYDPGAKSSASISFV